MFEYDSIIFAWSSRFNVFIAITDEGTENDARWKLDNDTGQIAGEYIGGSGGNPTTSLGYESQSQKWFNLDEYSRIGNSGTFEEVIEYIMYHSDIHGYATPEIFFAEQVTIEDLAWIEGFTDEEYGIDGYIGLGKFAFANRYGLITDFIFDGIDQKQSTTSFAVKVGNRWGFINSSGQQIIDFVFEDAVSIDDQRAFVKYNGKWGIIQKGT